MLKGRTAFVTGTSRGLGRAFVEAFAANGADVFAHARAETPEFLRWCGETAARHGVQVTPVCFDLADTAAMKEGVRRIIAERRPVNILVNNAGVAHGGLFQMTAVKRIREVFEVNFFAQLELTQQLLRYIAKCGHGSIINLSSVLGIDLPAGSCAYGVSKAAVAAFTRTLAAETAGIGVRVNAIAPGLVDTDMGAQMEPNAEARLLADSAMKRKATPGEIAAAAVYLASDQSSFVNGQVMVLNGGRA